jgi:hypothetical protein
MASVPEPHIGFTKGEAPVFDEKKITREAYDNLFGPNSFLKPIKQKIDSPAYDGIMICKKLLPGTPW